MQAVVEVEAGDQVQFQLFDINRIRKGAHSARLLTARWWGIAFLAVKERD